MVRRPVTFSQIQVVWLCQKPTWTSVHKWLKIGTLLELEFVCGNHMALTGSNHRLALILQSDSDSSGCGQYAKSRMENSGAADAYDDSSSSESAGTQGPERRGFNHFPLRFQGERINL